MMNQPAGKTPLSLTCQTCANAKVKCSRTKHFDVCDRCLRLGKECVFRKATRRFKGWRKDARIEALEAKVQELMTDRDSPGQTGSGAASYLDVDAGRSSSISGRSPSPNFSSEGDPDGLSPESVIDPITLGTVPLEMAEMLLEEYKISMTPHFPFVIVPAHTTAEQLRDEKPFLLLAILASASYNQKLTLQRMLGKEVKRHVAAKMVVGGDMTLELLQGLIVFLAWRHYHSRPRKHSQYLHLAISIVSELRLFCRPNSNWSTAVYFDQDHDLTKVSKDTQSLEEQRAFLGCYYLSSCVSKLLQKMSMPKLPYLEDCCKNLEENPEYPTDKYIPHIIKFQMILDQIDHMFIRDSSDLDVAAGDSPSQLHIDMLRSKLDTATEEASFPLTESSSLYILAHTTRLFLYQISLLGLNQHHRTSVSSWRIDTLCAGLAAAKAVLEFFVAMPASAAKSLPNLQYVQLGFCVIVATKLSVTSAEPMLRRQTEGWRTALNMEKRSDDVLGQVSRLTTPQIDMDGDRDCFYHFELRIKRLQQWYRKQTDPSSQMHGDFDPAGHPHQQHPHIHPQLQQPQSQHPQVAAGASTAPMPQYRQPSLQSIEGNPTFEFSPAGPDLTAYGMGIEESQVWHSPAFGDPSFNDMLMDWVG